MHERLIMSVKDGCIYNLGDLEKQGTSTMHYRARRSEPRLVKRGRGFSNGQYKLVDPTLSPGAPG
jgi:hypothetical protein